MEIGCSEEADKYAIAAINARDSINVTDLLSSDMKVFIKTKIPGTSKITKMTRLQLSHTKLAHLYMINKEPKPRCSICNVELTVKHFPIDCPQFINERKL